MTIVDFKEYLNTLDPKNADILEIGKSFKLLPVRQRNWEWLFTYLKEHYTLPEEYANITSNAYRQRVDRYCKATGSVEAKNIPTIDSKDKEKQQLRDWYTAYRRNIREESRIDTLINEIKSAADKFKDLPVNLYKDTTVDNNKEAVLLISDLHLGVDCDNYYNTYNKDIAVKRLNKLANNTIYYCKLNGIKRLNVLNLGDMIHGIIHSNARIEAQMDVAEQIILAGEYISNFLNKLTEACPEITYRSCYDNHSRAIADKNQHIEKEQFSRIIDWFIKERLKNTNIKFIDNDIDGGIGSIQIFDKKAIFAHGHQDNKNTSVQNFIGLTQEWIDYIFLAHYHNSAVKEFQGCKVFINGSIVGTEQYAFGKRLFSKPSQKLIIFSKDTNNIQDIDINLDV